MAVPFAGSLWSYSPGEQQGKHQPARFPTLTVTSYCCLMQMLWVWSHCYSTIENGFATYPLTWVPCSSYERCWELSWLTQILKHKTYQAGSSLVASYHCLNKLLFFYKKKSKIHTFNCSRCQKPQFQAVGTARLHPNIPVGYFHLTFAFVGGS